MTRPDREPPLGLGDGRLLQSRVIDEFETILETVLQEQITGYVRVEPGKTLILDAEERGVITFTDGIPMAAYHAGVDVAGDQALSKLSTLGPFRVELYAVSESRLTAIHNDHSLLVPPGRPAERLAGDPQLAERTRAMAPEQRLEQARQESEDALTAFLEDQSRIKELREQAQTEAKRRAKQWGLDSELE